MSANGSADLRSRGFGVNGFGEKSAPAMACERARAGFEPQAAQQHTNREASAVLGKEGLNRRVGGTDVLRFLPLLDQGRIGRKLGDAAGSELRMVDIGAHQHQQRGQAPGNVCLRGGGLLEVVRLRRRLPG